MAPHLSTYRISCSTLPVADLPMRRRGRLRSSTSNLLDDYASFDPSVASIGAVGGRLWVAVDHVTYVGGGAYRRLCK